MNIYLIVAYFTLAGACVAGALSRHFDGDSLQRLGLAVLFFCFLYRAHMLTYIDYSWPHEPPLITGLLLVASGAIRRTLRDCSRHRRYKKLLNKKVK